jgi:hypothetical protein
MMKVAEHTKKLINKYPYYAEMKICPLAYHGYRETENNIKQVIEEIRYELSVYPENCDILLDQIGGLNHKLWAILN